MLANSLNLFLLFFLRLKTGLQNLKGLISLRICRNRPSVLLPTVTSIRRRSGIWSFPLRAGSSRSLVSHCLAVCVPLLRTPDGLWPHRSLSPPGTVGMHLCPFLPFHSAVYLHQCFLSLHMCFLLFFSLLTISIPPSTFYCNTRQSQPLRSLTRGLLFSCSWAEGQL